MQASSVGRAPAPAGRPGVSEEMGFGPGKSFLHSAGTSFTAASAGDQPTDLVVNLVNPSERAAPPVA